MAKPSRRIIAGEGATSEAQPADDGRRSSTRMLVLWCPDWPVVAWGVPLDEPAAVVVANRVIACSPAAREEGVAVGIRRRDAQGRCPDLAILERDVDREGRLFEPVAVALEGITPEVEVSGPGLVGFPTRGPSRFFGGDAMLTDEVVAAVEPVLAGRGACRVGVADGVFAARLAARAVRPEIGDAVVIPPGESASFLAPVAIGEVGNAELADVLGRLGLTTLGAFAALAPADVVGRFGQAGQSAHRLARGGDEHPPDLRRPAPDMAVTWQFEPAAVRIDRCAFAAKALADELHATLTGNGLACVRVAIEAETESGETHVRLWRHEGALSAGALAERARWQLDGWLHIARSARQAADANARTITAASSEHADAAEPDEVGVGSGIVRLSLIPDEVVAATGRQLGFWGGRAERADEVTRAVARIQGLLGPESVSVPEWRGGRGPIEQISLIPAAAVDLGEERVATQQHFVSEPWPGRLPMPAPAKVSIDPAAIELLDAGGSGIGVTGRGELTSQPSVVVGATRRRTVQAWAGPWPADERWWDVMAHRRRARMQVVLEDGSAHLLVIEDGTWWLEASYQ